MHACKRSFVGARGKRSPFPGSFSPTETRPEGQGRYSNDARCGRGRATRPLHLQCSRNFISPPSASACLEALCGETKVPTARFASPATLNGRELRPRTRQTDRGEACEHGPRCVPLTLSFRDRLTLTSRFHLPVPALAWGTRVWLENLKPTGHAGK